MFRLRWPVARLQQILAEAESSGETLITFPTVSEAKRFRFACYNLRRRTNATSQLSFELQTTDDSIAIRVVRHPKLTLTTPSLESRL